MKTIANYKDYDRVMCFLQRLGETYNTVKTQILLTEPLLRINRVFSLVLQQERHLNESMGINTKVLINSANQQRTNNKTNNGNHGWRNYGRGRGKNYGKQCSFCNKMNNTADECYSKHGFPPRIKQRSVANAFEKDEENEAEKGKSTHEEALNEQIIKGLGTKQLQQLVDMIQSSKNKEKVINNTIGECPKISKNSGKEGISN